MLFTAQTTRHILIVLFVSSLTACNGGGNSGGGNDTTTDTTTTTTDTTTSTDTTTPGNDDDSPCSDGLIRSELGFCSLTEDASLNGPVSLSAFASATGASQPRNTFEGRLSLDAESSAGSISVITGFVSDEQHHLPEFDFEFVQDGSNLIPSRRGVIQLNSGGHPDWEYILEVGRVWDEADDDGYSRAAIPFALQERNQNCVHNGVLTFLFKDDGSTSNAAYQISSETCLYLKMDMWGLLEADYSPGSVSNVETIKAEYQNEIAKRMTVKPLAELASDYPGINFDFDNFGRGVTAEHMSAYGLVVGDVHYVAGCETRNGSYPYCDQMILPSYSTAKSAFAGTALMRLEQKYPGAKNNVISQHVPECASDGDWSDVTFGNAVDMATGNYTSPLFQVDEGNFGAFANSLTHADKIDFACTEYARRITPGVLWVYHTADTYAVTTAMNDYLKAAEDSGKDIFTDTIVADLWTPLQISPTAKVSKRTYDGTAQAWGGYGLNFLRDDVAKIARFLNRDAGQIEGIQLLDSSMLGEALQQGGAAPYGLTSGAALSYYKNGFWAFQSDAFIGCGKAVWVPYMSGFGGITIALFPNGISYYYFSDNDEFLGTWVYAATEAQKIASMCTP
jgi:hypothetical protein